MAHRTVPLNDTAQNTSSTCIGYPMTQHPQTQATDPPEWASRILANGRKIKKIGTPFLRKSMYVFAMCNFPSVRNIFLCNHASNDMLFWSNHQVFQTFSYVSKRSCVFTTQKEGETKKNDPFPRTRVSKLGRHTSQRDHCDRKVGQKRPIPSFGGCPKGRSLPPNL